MSNKIANRVKMTVSGTPGTGTITLGSAVAGFQSFAASGVSNADTVPYIIEDGAAWEIGVGTYTSTGTTMSRSVTASSNSGNAINATSAAIVMISPLAADLQGGTAAGNLVSLDGSARIPAVDGSLLTSLNVNNAGSGTLAVARGGTGTGTTFTAGSVVFAAASGVYSQNNSGLFWDNTNGSLLLGTVSSLASGDLEIRRSSTSLNLDLYSANASGNPKVRFYNNTNQGAIGYTSDQALAFYNNSTTTERVRITGAGNVGIGTSSPGVKLDVVGQIRTPSNQSGAGGYLLNYSALNAASRTWRLTNDIIAYGDFAIQQSTTQAGSTYTNMLSIDATGNLGLGVTPSAWYSSYSTRAIQVGALGSLHYDGYTGTTTFGYNAYQSGATTYSYLQGSTPASRYTQSNGVHQWFTAASGTAGNAISFTQAMTLDASGNLGIGTTSPSSYLTRCAAVAPGEYGASFVAVSNSSVNNWARIDLKNVNQATTTYWHKDQAGVMGLVNEGAHAMYFGTNNTERVRIDSDGTFRVKGGGVAGTTDAFQVAGGAPASAARIDSSGNLLVGTSSSPTSGTKCLTVGSGTAAAASPADTITIYSTDLSAGNTMLSLYTEGTVVNSNETAAATHRIAIRVNGTVYYLLANTSA